MGEAYHELDPDGDIVLILKDPDTAFAVWDESPQYPLPPPVSTSPSSAMTCPPVSLEPPSELVQAFESLEPPEYGEPDSSDSHRLTPGSHPGEQSTSPSRRAENGNLTHTEISSCSVDVLAESVAERVRMRVSSRHLILASPYFRRMLTGGWKESQTLDSNNCLLVHIQEWDADAFLILMDIIHHRTRKVPRSITFEMLAKFAVLVDYYECHEPVEVFSDIWIAKFEKEQPKTYSRDLILWIWITWVFRKPELFKTATSTAIKQSPGPIQTLGLPIPKRIVDEIDQQRQESINRMVASLHRHLVNMRKGRQQTC